MDDFLIILTLDDSLQCVFRGTTKLFGLRGMIGSVTRLLVLVKTLGTLSESRIVRTELLFFQ